MIKTLYFSAYLKHNKLFDYMSTTAKGKEADTELDLQNKEIANAVLRQLISKEKGIKKTKLYFVGITCDWLEGKKEIKNVEDYVILEIQPMDKIMTKRYNKNLKTNHEVCGSINTQQDIRYDEYDNYIIAAGHDTE